eukprot:gene11621-10078_t
MFPTCYPYLLHPLDRYYQAITNNAKCFQPLAPALSPFCPTPRPKDRVVLDIGTGSGMSTFLTSLGLFPFIDACVCKRPASWF